MRYKKIKIGQIGIGHNHGEAKMLAVLKFPELFEVIGYAEENERWIEKRGEKECYKTLPRLSVEDCRYCGLRIYKRGVLAYRQGWQSHRR